MSDYSFARKPSEDTEKTPDEWGMGAFEIEGPSSSKHNNDDINNSTATISNNNNRGRRPRGVKIKKFGKKLGGALQKINVVKWIDDLETDQNLADQLDRINTDNADEQERQDICRQAMEACMNSIKEHLLEFLDEYPQATYEEWICNLHPDNINGRMEGLTQTPMIDHRFYVSDSDHRILWNEHLNDLEDSNNLTPVRHFVASRSFQQQTVTKTSVRTEHTVEPDPFATFATPFATSAATFNPSQPSLLDNPLPAAVSNDNHAGTQDDPNPNNDGGVVDLLSF